MKEPPALYPQLGATSQTSDATAPDAQQFRLQKIDELEVFLRSEVEARSCLYKKYRRAVNALDGTCAVV